MKAFSIACYAIQAKVAYLYIRGEYHKWVNLMQKTVDEAYENGLIGERMKQTFGKDFSW